MLRAQNWRKILLGVALCFILICPVVWAQSVQDVPNPRQENRSWISDQATLLSPALQKSLNQRINQLKARTTAELAIATLPALDTSQDTRTFALELFNNWKIGNRFRNNGVLLLVLEKNRRVEIITGKGLQTILPDAEVSTLIEREMIPAFRRTDYGAGIKQGTVAIAQILEKRLPPMWLPLPIVGFLGVIGIGLGIVGYGGLHHFLETSLKIIIPTQGLDQETFCSSASWLATISFPELLAKLFNPDTNKKETLPRWIQVNLCLSGTLFGLAIALGIQSILVPSNSWGTVYVSIFCGSINTIAGIGGLLIPVLLLQRQLSDERWAILLFPLAFSSLGAIIIDTQAVPWFWIVIIILLFNFLSIGFWALVSDSLLNIQRPWQYLGDRTQKPIQSLTPEEIEALLEPAEKMAQSMGHLSWQGWRDAEINFPLTREKVYLVRGKNNMAITCPQCKSLTIEESVQTIEKTVPVQKKKKKQPQPTTTLIQFKETTFLCRFCGHSWIREEAIPPAHNLLGNTESDYGTTTYTQSISTGSDYSDNSYNNNYEPSSSQSDFGGGSSDGGGAGDSW